ncbi:hypothetical protein [Clostridium sp.]|uniref:hypothetical protein n=1 Tax=Clostridium sp. TaxID=1506 RepID=UPI002A7FFE15|nr:hypothetical protein [Clostridium sp.]MDY4252635.1 hypothetical protein [Clostridium sp.]
MNVKILISYFLKSAGFRWISSAGIYFNNNLSSRELSNNIWANLNGVFSFKLALVAISFNVYFNLTNIQL